MTSLRRIPGSSSAASRGKVTLARALSKLGYSSRSQARVLIESGEVAVNDRIVTDPDRWLDLSRDRVRVGGKDLRKTPVRGLLLYKPADVVTSRADERGRRTVFDLLGPAANGLKTVGRLDRDTTGALLVLSDSRLADALTDPQNHVEKMYVVESDAALTGEEEQALRQGVRIVLRGESYQTRPAALESLGDHRYRLTITEGKNRQIRRMFESLGRSVVRLHREVFAGLALGPLKPGAWRELTPNEIRNLRMKCAR